MDNGDGTPKTEYDDDANAMLCNAMHQKKNCLLAVVACIFIRSSIRLVDGRYKTGLDIPRDNGLKLFLEKEDMERLYDFEEECVEGYFRESEIALHQSTEERIKTTNERVENMSQKVEDINQKENLQSATVQVSLYIVHAQMYVMCVRVHERSGQHHFVTLPLWPHSNAHVHSMHILWTTQVWVFS